MSHVTLKPISFVNFLSGVSTLLCYSGNQNTFTGSCDFSSLSDWSVFRIEQLHVTGARILLVDYKTSAQCYKIFFHRKSRCQNFPQIFNSYYNGVKQIKYEEKCKNAKKCSQRNQLWQTHPNTAQLKFLGDYQNFGGNSDGEISDVKSVITSGTGVQFPR